MSGLTPPAAPGVIVMPAAEAYDFEYFRDRVDAVLLSRSIAVRVFRMPLLAVPVGGVRRGGSFGADSLAVALAVRDVLAPLSGFPGARITWQCTPRSSYAVEWGDRPPVTWLDDNERLAFYGLTRPALALEPEPDVGHRDRDRGPSPALELEPDVGHRDRDRGPSPAVFSCSSAAAYNRCPR